MLEETRPTEQVETKTSRKILILIVVTGWCIVDMIWVLILWVTQNKNKGR